jgi:hypothetical protein
MQSQTPPLKDGMAKNENSFDGGPCRAVAMPEIRPIHHFSQTNVFSWILVPLLLKF